MPARLSYTREELVDAVARSHSYAETLRALSLSYKGRGSYQTLKKYIDLWDIDTSHFDPYRHNGVNKRRRTLPELLVRGSTVSSDRLKKRLYNAGVKKRQCERCGQGEMWQGARMSLILDHINGDCRDNRLSNLRILCPNCNATLETHTSRMLRIPHPCRRCDNDTGARNRVYCGKECRQAARAEREASQGETPLGRPPYEDLIADVLELGWEGAGRKHGVTGNSVRKWVKRAEQIRNRSGKPIYEGQLSRKGPVALGRGTETAALPRR